MTHPVEIVEGAGPNILAMPHAGLDVPDDIASALNPTGVTLSDTHWHMELTQSTYLDSEHPPFSYSETRAARLRPHLAAILTRLEQLAVSGEPS